MIGDNMWYNTDLHCVFTPVKEVQPALDLCSIPLSEWIFMNPYVRPKLHSNNNTCITIITCKKNLEEISMYSSTWTFTNNFTFERSQISNSSLGRKF